MPPDLEVSHAFAVQITATLNWATTKFVAKSLSFTLWNVYFLHSATQ